MIHDATPDATLKANSSGRESEASVAGITVAQGQRDRLVHWGLECRDAVSAQGW